jgi:putative ABC transport system permease protein
MDNSLPIIALQDLILVFIPALLVVWILFRWSMQSGAALYALGRMMLQLLAIGYLLTYIFETDSPALVLFVLLFMLTVASWIAIRPIAAGRRQVYLRVLGAISVGGISTLAIVTIGVLHLDPWFAPRVFIPLAGMIFANSMNTTSLAIERLESELSGGRDFDQSRQRAYRAALLPLTNSLLAVGLVSLPGMMTGQIISGVSPTVAVRYQIVVMCMLFGASGISAACYLAWARGLHALQIPDLPAED